MDAAHLIRAARRRSGLSQRDLAAQAGVARSTIADLEAGKHSPTAALLDRVLAVSGLELAASPRAAEDADAALVRHLRLSLTQRLRIALGESPVLPAAARSPVWRALGALARRGQVVLEPPLAHAMWLPLGRVPHPAVSVFHAKTTLDRGELDVRVRPGDAPAAAVSFLMEVGERVSVMPPGELALPTERDARLRQADLMLQAYAPRDDGARRRPAHRDPDEANEDWRLLKTKSVRERPDLRNGRGWRLGASASLAQRLRER